MLRNAGDISAREREKIREGWEGGIPGSLSIKLEELQDMATWCVCTQAGQRGLFQSHLFILSLSHTALAVC